MKEDNGKKRKGRIKEFFLGLFGKLKQRDINTYAASAAFFLFLSFLPIVILMLLFLPLTGISSDDLTSMVTDVTPDFIDGLVTELIVEAYGKTSGILPITVIIIIFSAAQGVTALIRGIRLVYDIQVKGSQLFLNLLGIISMLAIVVFLIGAAVGLFFADGAFHRIVEDGIEITALAWLLLRLRYLIMMGLFALLLTLLFSLISGAKKNPKLHLPGAIVSSVSCAVFTGIFSFFIRFNQSYRTIYGNFASFIVLLLWGYICIYLILIGGCLNRYLMDRREKEGEETSRDS